MPGVWNAREGGSGGVGLSRPRRNTHGQGHRGMGDPISATTVPVTLDSHGPREGWEWGGKDVSPQGPERGCRLQRSCLYSRPVPPKERLFYFKVTLLDGAGTLSLLCHRVPHTNIY